MQAAHLINDPKCNGSAAECKINQQLAAIIKLHQAKFTQPEDWLLPGGPA